MASKAKIEKANRKPKFSSRIEYRCQLCGRPRAVYRKFKICRICFRELCHEGKIPGMKKSSWQTGRPAAIRGNCVPFPADPAVPTTLVVTRRIQTTMMTDPIADMLTRIRNALRIERPSVDIPCSKIKTAIAETLQREGYIWDFEVIEAQPQNVLRINLKYGPNGEQVVQYIQRTSKPGRRIYCAADELGQVRQGLGVSIVSTSKGVLSNREARKQGIGGEVLCTIW